MSASMPPLPADPARYYRLGAPYAGWWRRVLASILDGLIPFIPTFALGAVLHATGLIDRGSENLWAVLIFASIVTWHPLYFGLTMSRPGPRNGQTWAKQWLRIRVVRGDRRPLGGWYSVLREVLVKWALLGACAIVSLIDSVWPLWDDHKQALHDKIVSTFVVRA